MSKKEKRKSQIQELIIFKGKLAQIKTEKKVISSEVVEQEDNIKFYYELAPFGAVYRYSCLISNESNAPITEIKTKIKIPKNLQLSRYSPSNIKIDKSKSDSEFQVINANFEKLDGNSKQQINLFLNLLNLNINSEISTSISYVNAKDLIKAHNATPTKVILSPGKIEPKIIPSFQVTEFLKIEGIKKAIKSFGVGIEGKPYTELYYNQVNELLKKHNFQLITKDDTKKIAWYFGTNLDSKEDILIIGQIVSNKVEFLAASKNPSIIIYVLNSLEIDFKSRISSLSLVKIDQIYNLECVQCGNILPTFPNKKGVAVKCQKCNKEQIIW
jgi:hypothetical protein